jgi:GNAT superfamily N-acetyltransferase
MAGPVSEDELIRVEKIFADKGVDTYIGLCPLADPSVLPLLASRGYGIGAFLNCYVRHLADEDLDMVEVKGVSISRLSADRAREFPAWSVAGYRDGGRAELLLDTVARVAASRKDTSLYVATVDGKVAGSGCMALIETTKGGVAYLYLDSTLPEFRGRGIHAALLRARLADAKKADFGLASIGARPGNGGSCRNIERAGFSLAYTRIWCGKAHE